MAGDEPGMAGDCCRADGIQPDLYIDDYVRFRTWTTIYIWPCGPLDNTQSSFSIISTIFTLNTRCCINRSQLS